MDSTHGREAQEARGVAVDCSGKLAVVTGRADTLEREHGRRFWVAVKTSLEAGLIGALVGAVGMLFLVR
jgi:hypothetical protein